MTNSQHSLLTRPDTFFGVCQGIGDNLGIHPNLFRVAFGMAVFFAPLATVATYFLLGLVVAGTHYLFPLPLPEAEAPAEAAAVAAGQTDEETFKLAA